MIKNIIKLDGRIEEFSPHKANGWSEWAAAHLGDNVDWGSIVMEATSELPETVTSQQFQAKLIEKCNDRKTWSYYLMAGRLYAVLLRKEIYGLDGIPTIKALHTRMYRDGIMVKLNYSSREYAQINKMIDHDKDLQCPHFALHHIRGKYALQNRHIKKEYETQQFVYMRMAMALSENEPEETRLEHVKNFYELFSNKQLSAPTPNYVNLGTVHRGFASCCLIASSDTGQSLSIGHYIADTMTQNSAGIGMNTITRSMGDPVRNGLFLHQGRKGYYDVTGKAVKSNLQNGRGGALNMFYSAYDPEAEAISQLRNPRSTEAKRNRDMHYALIANKWFARKAAKKGEQIFTFNCFTAPDLHAALYSNDLDKFVELYNKYENDPTFVKNYIDARELLKTVLNEAYETGVSYLAQIDEINRHTPFKEPIYSSNLCVEITQPTVPYLDMRDLFKEEDHGRGEISTCSLAAIAVDNVKDAATYRKAAYYALKMIDYCILNSNYPFEHLKLTATSRMNAGVGIMGLATHMAEAGLGYTSEAGKRELHFVAERHMYHMIEASLKISKERGLAPWMHKTKWPEGWLPLDTYTRAVDELVPNGFDLTYNWEKLRAEIIANGGIGHSALVAYMPGEASSKALGGANSIYPVRRKVISKKDNNITISWAAPHSDNPKYFYELAWDIPTKELINFYAIFQKFTDQSISADWYRRIIGAEKISSNEMLSDYFHMVKMGQKTRYYQNTEVSAGLDLAALESAFSNNDGDRGCAAGGCTL